LQGELAPNDVDRKDYLDVICLNRSAAQRGSKEQHPISVCGRAEMIYMKRFTELSLDSFRNVSADLPPKWNPSLPAIESANCTGYGRPFLLFRTLQFRQTSFVNSGKWPLFGANLRLTSNSDYGHFKNKVVDNFTGYRMVSNLINFAFYLCRYFGSKTMDPVHPQFFKYRKWPDFAANFRLTVNSDRGQLKSKVVDHSKGYRMVSNLIPLTFDFGRYFAFKTWTHVIHDSMIDSNYRRT
jgi:hypothetical protein